MKDEISKLLEYFLEPKRTRYDIPKTITYGFLFVVAAYGIYKLLKKLKIGINRELAIAAAPYVVLGSSTRVLEDMGLISGYIFVTPSIYIFIFLITFGAILFSLFVEKKTNVPYFKITFLFGALLLSIPLSYISISLLHINLYGLYFVAIFFAPWLLLVRINWSLENKVVMLLQMFDATVTFVSLQFFSFYEQHILPTAFISVFGPASFIIVKAVVVVALLLAIDKLSKDREFNSYIKLVIGILGAATGIRDFLALLVLG